MDTFIHLVVPNVFYWLFPFNDCSVEREKNDTATENEAKI